METIVNVIYLILFMLFCICVIAKQYLYVSFIFLIFGTKGLSFIPAMTLKPRLFILMCLLTFCMFNFKAVKRRIKHDKLVRRLFHICLFFIFSMAFSIIYWNLSIVSVLNAGLPFLLISSTVVFLPMTYKEYRKLFNIVFYITFVASIIYIIQCFLGKALLPISWVQETEKRGVRLVASHIYRFWVTPPFMIEFIPISIFCRKIVPPALRAISPIVFISGLFCTMYRTHIGAAIACIFFLMWLTGSISKNFKSIIILLIVFAIFGSALTERVTRGNNSTERDVAALVSGDFSVARSNVSNGMTLMYRAGWVMERVTYLVKNPVELLMGLPLTNDKAFMNSRYSFKFGLVDDDGNIEQADTPDIAYGMMLTRYGLIGTFFLFRMIFLLLRRLYKNRHISELSMALFGYLCSQFIAAVSSTNLAEPLGYVSIFFLYDYAMRMIEGDPPKRTKALPAKR